jgi:hypothetical protein
MTWTWLSNNSIMPNVQKSVVLGALEQRFGKVRKLGGSESLFDVGDDAARIYFRYSKVHSGNRTFFGLREVDLRQLEGRNGFLCLLIAGETEPLFIPYAGFEEIFREATTARDGQFKVQLINRDDARQLYVAREGTFNVEGFVGIEALYQNTDPTRLAKAQSLSHVQVQTLLAAIGHAKGHDVYVPRNDAGRLDWSLTPRFSLLRKSPEGFDAVAGILTEVDVVWFKAGRGLIEALYEIEYSTPVYSGLLRFNDVLLTDSRISRFAIVSNDGRRGLFTRQLHRPTFERSGLSELCSFLEFANVLDWHDRVVTEN